MEIQQNKIKNTSQSVYNSLKELGLTEHEISLYMVSLKMGPSTIKFLADNLQISRPNVYKVIKGLEEHKLAKFSNKEKFTRNFMVESPTILLEKLREKRNSLAEIDQKFTFDLPELLTTYNQGAGDSKIKIYKGKSEYINIFKQSLEEENKEIIFFGSSKDFVQFVSWDIEKKWIEDRVKKGISIRVLTVPSDFSDKLLKDDKNELRKTRIIECKDFSSSFMLFGNKVVFWQPKAPLAIIIQDQFLFEMMKIIFEKAWEQVV